MSSKNPGRPSFLLQLTTGRLLVQRLVELRRTGPGEVPLHRPLDDDLPRGLVPKARHGPAQRPEHPLRVAGQEGEPVPTLRGVRVGHGVLQAAHLAHHRDRAVAHGDHLREPAGLEDGRHQKDAAARIEEVGERLVVPLEEADAVRVGSGRSLQGALDPALTAPQEDYDIITV